MRNKKAGPKRAAPKKSNARQIYNATVPYSPGTPFTTLKLDGFCVKYTTTITTGQIAASVAIQTGNIASFSTRFGTAFDECRIVSVMFKAYPCSSTNPGLVNMWVEPQSNAAPTSALCQANRPVVFAAGGNDKVARLKYTPTDFNYSDWIPVTTTTSVVGYFNIFTNNADFASSAVVTDYVVIRAEYVVQFRGLA